MLRICTAKVILHCFNKGGGGVITECRGIEPEQTIKILTIFVTDQCKHDSENQNTENANIDDPPYKVRCPVLFLLYTWTIKILNRNISERS